MLHGAAFGRAMPAVDMSLRSTQKRTRRSLQPAVKSKVHLLRQVSKQHQYQRCDRRTNNNPPFGLRAGRNEPCNIIEVFQALAGARGGQVCRWCNILQIKNNGCLPSHHLTLSYFCLAVSRGSGCSGLEHHEPGFLQSFGHSLTCSRVRYLLASQQRTAKPPEPEA